MVINVVKVSFLILMFTLMINAQNVTVQKIKQLTQLEQGEFFNPVVSPKGQIFFTRAGYSGLYSLESGGDVQTTSTLAGAGYQPVFSKDGNFIYFRPYRYDGMKKLSSLVRKSLVDGKEQLLIKDEREFSTAKRMINGSVVVNRNSELNIVDDSQSLLKNFANQKAVFIENGKIVLFTNNEKKILAPLGEGFYLWPSISPDGSKLLFAKAGQGTFITTLNGDIQVDLGYANAPQWSTDGQWIVFMHDLDDGHQLTESDIYIISADGSKKIAITQTAEIKEIYPFWGVENEIVFGSDKGIIYKVLLDLN